MKKMKTLLLSIGSLTLIGTSVASVISCGSTASTNKYTGTFSSNAQKDKFLKVKTSVADLMFQNESKLTSITLNSVTSIGNKAFENAPLTSVNIPKVATIGDNAFEKSTLATLNLPQATSIGSNAFVSSKNLKSLTLPLVSHIGFDAFINSKITGTLSLPKLTDVHEFVFGHSLLTHVDLPMALTIENDAFNEFQIKTLDLPVTTTIGKDAFLNSPLTSLKLPKITQSSITAMATPAFNAIVNAATTHVTLPTALKNDANKNKLFGTGHWTNIDFS